MFIMRLLIGIALVIIIYFCTLLICRSQFLEITMVISSRKKDNREVVRICQLVAVFCVTMTVMKAIVTQAYKLGTISNNMQKNGLDLTDTALYLMKFLGKVDQVAYTFINFTKLS